MKEDYNEELKKLDGKYLMATFIDFKTDIAVTFFFHFNIQKDYIGEAIKMTDEEDRLIFDSGKLKQRKDGIKSLLEAIKKQDFREITKEEFESIKEGLKDKEKEPSDKFISPIVNKVVSCKHERFKLDDNEK